MGVEVEIGWRIADHVLRVLGVVPAQEGPGPVPVVAVQVLHPGRAGLFGEDGDGRLEARATVARGQPVEVTDHALVILGQHGGNGVDRGAEVEQAERAQRLPHGCIHQVAIDITEGREGRLREDRGTLEGERSFPVEAGARVRFDRISVSIARRYVDSQRRQRQVDRLRRRAHGEEEAAAIDVLPNSHRYRLLETRRVGQPESPRCAAVTGHLLLQPGRACVRQVELGVLAGEILVVQMQPVVAAQFAAQHFRVPQVVVLDTGVGKRQRHRIIPRLRPGRRVDGDPRCLFQDHRLHVRAVDLAAHCRQT